MQSGERVDSLLRKIADGDRDALAELHSAVKTPVYAYALSVLKNPADAEDVMQETFMEIWRCSPKYESIGKPMGWVIAIARGLCMSKLREQERLSYHIPAEPLPQAGSELSEDRLLIRACIEALTDREREIIAMHAVAGLRYREIATLTGEPLSTVISRYNRAVKKLRRELEGGGNV